ncbi:hypothetical protein [Clostridium kluyveri]|uniref:hypothetical protein n=1 Tax=Clostridium kluyveri TaxID=1534 RepID=UPI0003027675|nr:hypothetical protein [Clostridium kluyveri]
MSSISFPSIVNGKAAGITPSRRNIKGYKSKEIYNCDKSVEELFGEEKEFLLSKMPLYETARI